MRTITKEILWILALPSIFVDSLQGQWRRNEIPSRIRKQHKQQQRNYFSVAIAGLRQHTKAPKSTKLRDSHELQTQKIYKDIDAIQAKNAVMQKKFRKIHRVEKFARLPVWPVLNGVLIWIIGNLFGFEKAAQLENSITGRVCPNFYEYSITSPYIMLVHHCHTFSTFDPVRYIQRTFFPEGFPAHPHRGFITITYILHGGFIHRDSEGVYQAYGSVNDPSTNETNRYNGKHTQWLTTGRGMLHEEMFDITTKFDLNRMHSRQELFQIWLNVPARYKMDEPHSLLLGGKDETPIVYGDDGISKTLVIAGTFNGQSSIAPLVTELALFHVTLQPGASWEFKVPSSLYETAFIYLRQGTLQSVASSTNEHNSNDAKITIPVHHTAYFERHGGNTIQVLAGSDDVADFMFLAGVPIKEPCYASGSMVMNYPNEIDEAYSDYQKGLFGVPWDYKLSNEDWKIHVQSTERRNR